MSSDGEAFDEDLDPEGCQEEEARGDDQTESPAYGEPEYWENRYATFPDPFDWYETWPQLLNMLGAYFNSSQLALNIGCGNSMTAVEMGSTFKTVVNIDISATVIMDMESRFKEIPNLLWFAMDCTKLSFDDEMFDVAFDKGTLDAIMCGDNMRGNVESTLREVFRVLRPGGLFFEITYGTPENRVSFFQGFGIDWVMKEPLSLHNPEKGGWHWIYPFEKLPTENSTEI
jgi:ubiquinone/menaquinone biosynthesis C-methylase UbiE